jgi:RNA polymerase sigma-70 factor (ECF subfamily)
LAERLRRREDAEALEDVPADPDEEYSWFFREEFANVTRTVSLILRDRRRAEDVAQEAFIQLYRHWAKVSRYQLPEAWVRRVAIRLAVRTARRERLRGTLERGSTSAPATPATPDPDLAAAIGRLSPAQRAAVVLFYFEDRPVAQVADLLDCSTATAKVHLHRARGRLRELLGEGDVE